MWVIRCGPGMQFNFNRDMGQKMQSRDAVQFSEDAVQGCGSIFRRCGSGMWFNFQKMRSRDTIQFSEDAVQGCGSISILSDQEEQQQQQQQQQCTSFLELLATLELKNANFKPISKFLQRENIYRSSYIGSIHTGLNQGKILIF